ncbi:hypothetical protein K474DRAFT_484391 [Panus rudis PR-1116 ss-1]|nr:hypothetical protein K474DRAFT_484391 [Panus rudis PR-1116 ss-1]
MGGLFNVLRFTFATPFALHLFYVSTGFLTTKCFTAVYEPRHRWNATTFVTPCTDVAFSLETPAVLRGHCYVSPLYSGLDPDHGTCFCGATALSNSSSGCCSVVHAAFMCAKT